MDAIRRLARSIIEDARLSFGRTVARSAQWSTTDAIAWRPHAHLCSWQCKVFCLLSWHMRLYEVGKCRCCHTINQSYCQELSTSSDHSGLTIRWWESNDPDGFSV